MISFLRKIGRSIFLKLVLVFVATAVALAIAVGSIVRYVASDSSQRQLIGKNLAQYSTYLVDQIGTPPNLEMAKSLASRLGIGIHIKTASVDWSSRSSPLPRAPGVFQAISEFPNVRRARHRGEVLIKVHRLGADYVFTFGRRGGWSEHSHGTILLLVILVVGSILTLSYLAVRWLFKPLGWLTDGMKEMGSGRLDTTIPVRKHDELGDLAQTFNDMSVRIRDLVRAKQQLLLDVSHELRSPMTRMKVATEFIDDNKVKNQIKADLGEMETLTTEILESERLDSEQGGLSLEEIDLTQLLKDLVEIYGDLKPGIKMLTDQSVRARVDPERIKIVIRNVIDNALTYSAGQERPVEINVVSTPDHVCLTVEDFGEGIPEEDQMLIFEPFYRVDKSRHKETGGYGLGLSLCKKIMHAHGGDITVNSKLGSGTRFTMVFVK
ncbi:MAG: HAMP domain-containing sensor histidine kinase [Arenicellales bacterium]|nr:HAMP domain-containing sensor histidine kinase [Arenicellales bacterium]